MRRRLMGGFLTVMLVGSLQVEAARAQVPGHDGDFGQAWRFALVNRTGITDPTGAYAHAMDPGFDDSAWPSILPTELEAKRGGGKVSFLWFRTLLTIPTRIGAFDPAGAKVVLALCIDDYAEIWVNGDLPRAAGRPSPATIQMPDRISDKVDADR